MKKYIVIDTWTGEGYSDCNGTKIETFDNKILAERYAELEATKQLGYPVSDRFNGEEVIHDTLDEHDMTIFSWTSGNDLYEDYGTYQVHPLTKDAYAVMIRCNINEVDILTEEQYNNEIEEISSDFEDYDYPHKEDYFHYENNGDLFVQCFGGQDYDYQFRLIKNIK
jgi:hypothetical protein